MPRYAVFITAIVAVVATFQPASAQQPANQIPVVECCLELVLPVGARMVALGQANVARAGIDAVFVNPAALVDIEKTSLIINHSSVGDLESGTRNTRNAFSLVMRAHRPGTFGLTYQSIEYAPDISTDLAGNEIGQNSRFISIVILSFASQLPRGWAIGASYHMFNLGSTCVGICQVFFDDRTTHMADAGLRYAPPWMRNLVLGTSIVHFGQRQRVRNAPEIDVPPARIRAGAAYNVARYFTKDSTTTAWLHVDVVTRRERGAAAGINIGAEVGFDNIIFVRAGHASQADQTSLGGTAVGMGIKYQRFDINLAKSISTSQLFPSDPFYVSFGISF